MRVVNNSAVSHVHVHPKKVEDVEELKNEDNRLKINKRI